MKQPPWTDEQVKNLNEYQRSYHYRSFVCIHDHTDLIATNNGWVCPHCDYTRDWAHAWMIQKVT